MSRRLSWTAGPSRIMASLIVSAKVLMPDLYPKNEAEFTSEPLKDGCPCPLARNNDK